MVLHGVLRCSKYGSDARSENTPDGTDVMRLELIALICFDVCVLDDALFAGSIVNFVRPANVPGSRDVMVLS